MAFLLLNANVVKADIANVTTFEELATASEQPTLEEQLSEVQDNQLVMMDAIATSYEKEAELSENQLVLMNAIASLYEAQL